MGLESGSHTARKLGHRWPIVYLAQVYQRLTHCSPKQELPQHLLDGSLIVVEVRAGIEVVFAHQ